MTEIILTTGGIIAVAAYVSAILAVAAIGVIEEWAALSRMVSDVAHLNPGQVVQKPEPRARHSRATDARTGRWQSERGRPS